MARGPNRPHPAVPLSEAEGFAQLIRDRNAGRPMNRVLLAEAAGTKPSSSRWRNLVVAATRYGLTSGNYNADSIALTPLGESITAPRNSSERSESRRRAFQFVPIFARLLEHYSNNKVPERGFLKNTLEREPFEVDTSWSEEVADLFLSDGQYVGLVREISGSLYVISEGSDAVVEGAPADVIQEPIASELDSGMDRSNQELTPHRTLTPTADRLRPMQIFVAHGKRRKPLDQLMKILNEWKVPYLVAVDEPNAGRPISQKVADLMKACTAGIFIFTRDAEFTDGKDNVVYRPSENVIYELGAASLLYGRKIVILKEEGVTFPTDFSDLGWIEFEQDALDAKAMELLRELIALEAVRLVSVVGS